MIFLLFAPKIKTEDPENILYAAAVEILVVDSLVIGFLISVILS